MRFWIHSEYKYLPKLSWSHDNISWKLYNSIENFVNCSCSILYFNCILCVLFVQFSKITLHNLIMIMTSHTPFNNRSTFVLIYIFIISGHFLERFIHNVCIRRLTIDLSSMCLLKCHVTIYSQDPKLKTLNLKIFDIYFKYKYMQELTYWITSVFIFTFRSIYRLVIKIIVL